MRKNIRSLTLVLSVALLAVLLMAVAAPKAVAQVDDTTDGPTRTLYVSGSGQVSVQPDTVIVRIGVQTEAESAAAALDQNNEQMQGLVRLLRDRGVASADIQTQNVSLYPRYEDSGRDNRSQTLAGYTVTNIVEARLRQIDSVGEVLDAAIAAGGNRIESIRFDVSNPEQYLDAAREAAWDDAQAKAEQLAELSGVTLGSVLSLSEATMGPQPYVERQLMTDAAVPIEPGTQTISVSLQVSWLLEAE
ncbi:MAG: SIMPL domain-containing protein [Chloroflexota bacterium]